MPSNAAAEGLNYFPFLTQQPSPPSSSRTTPGSPCSGSGGFTGGQTTRRSLPRNLHGNYEGDFSMFTSRSNQAATATGSLMDQILEAGLDLRLDQHFAGNATEEEHFDEEADTVDEEIRAKIAEVKAKKTKTQPHSQSAKSKLATPRPNLWHCYKGKFFSPTHSKKIEDTWAKMEQNPLLQNVANGSKFAAFMITCVLRLLLFNVVIRAVNVSWWSAAGCRNMLRKGSRQLLWQMTLAKCGEVQLFGFIMLLSPLLFMLASLGLVFSLYCVIKHGIQSLIRYMRNIDMDEFEMPKIVDS